MAIRFPAPVADNRYMNTQDIQDLSDQALKAQNDELWCLIEDIRSSGVKAKVPNDIYGAYLDTCDEIERRGLA